MRKEQEDVAFLGFRINTFINLNFLQSEGSYYIALKNELSF